MPWKVFKEGNRFCVHKLTADNKKGEKVACHDTEAKANAQLRALYANTKETRGMFQDVAIVWELRGDFPTNIDFFPDVDIAELTKGDDDPMFLTIPIGKVNTTSGNKRFYDEAWLLELERQVISNRPIGIMGHLAEDELGTKFPDEAVHWVGVRRVNEMLWAKGYIPPGAARDRVRRYKATNKTLATSIFAKAEGIWNKARGALDMLAETLNLFQIDIGPADRVGIPALARVPMLTAEMDASGNGGDEIEEPTTMDTAKAIQELINTKVTPQKGWQAPANEEVPDIAGLRQEVTELRQQNEALMQAAVKQRVTELVSDGVKLESARGIVTELVSARNPQTPEEAQTAYAAVMEMASVKETLEATLQRTMGPSQRVHVAAQKGTNKYFPIPKEA